MPGYSLTVPYLEIKLYHRYVCLGHTSVQLHLTVCDPMDCSMPGFPVHQQAQTHVH